MIAEEANICRDCNTKPKVYKKRNGDVVLKCKCEPYKIAIGPGYKRTVELWNIMLENN